MKHELASVVLWLIAGAATYLLAPGLMTRLAPLYFVCAVGTALIVRLARRRAAGAGGPAAWRVAD